MQFQVYLLTNRKVFLISVCNESVVERLSTFKKMKRKGSALGKVIANIKVVTNRLI